MEERPIRFNLLHKDELVYEVTIRDAVPAETVTALRDQIRTLSKQIPTDEIVEYEGDTASELGIISNKLSELESLIASKPLPLKSLNRIQALGHHIFHRLGRTNPSKELDQTLKNEVGKRLEVVLIKVDRMFANFRSSQELVPGLSPPEASPGEVNENKIHPPSIKVSCGRTKGIHTLNFKFNGKTCVVAFIQRLEELCLSRGISDDELFESAAEIFAEDALFWYRGIKSDVRSWAELKKSILDEYLPFDYDYRLLQEIRARTQGPEERISHFLNIMHNYFSRLRKPLDDNEKLSIVRYNIRPFFSTQLALETINTWAELKSRCRLLEHAKQRADIFIDPPKASSSLLAADLSYKYTHKSSKTCAVVESKIKSLFCGRCRSNGHSLENCRMSRNTLHCFKCGEKGFTIRNCPKCNPVSNAPVATPTTSTNVPKN